LPYLPECFVQKTQLEREDQRTKECKQALQYFAASVEEGICEEDESRGTRLVPWTF